MNFPSFKKQYLFGYRLAGFAGLVFIAGMLVIYTMSFAFFLMNRTWAAPTILESTSEKILPVQAEMIRVRQFMSELKVAQVIKKAELENYRIQRESLVKLRARLLSAKGVERSENAKIAQESSDVVVDKQQAVAEMRAQTEAIAALAKQAKQEFEARLITEAEYSQRIISAASLASQRTDSRLTLVQSKAAAAERQRAAETMSGRSSSVAALDVDAKLLEIDSRIADLDVRIIQRESELLEGEPQLRILEDAFNALVNTPYSDVVKDGRLFLAFLPYDNHDAYKPGESVYGCALVFFICKKVGIVEKEYPNEQVVEFPLLNLRFSRTVRGTYVRLKLDDQTAAEKQVLFIGGKPLFL